MRVNFFSVDWLLLLPVFILLVLSLTTLWSLDVSLFRGQLFALVLSCFVFLFFLQVSFPLMRIYTPVIYGFSLIALFVVLILGIQSHGAIRWIDFFGFRIQLSEIIKPFLLLALASKIADAGKSLRQFFLILLYLVPIAVFIFLQPDLGNTLIYVVVTLSTLFTAGFSLLYFVFLGIISALLMPVVWLFLHDYQRQRIFTFIHPSKDPLGTSYNAVQALIAVGSGMFLGKGLSQGTQSSLRFLPERHTDFMFATVSEELGFVGSMIILLCFCFLLYRLYYIFKQTDVIAEKIFILGAFFLILIQFVMNMGMNVGILPIVGVTLPFVSYGGSSLLSNFILLGIISAISVSQKRSYRTLEIS